MAKSGPTTLVMGSRDRDTEGERHREISKLWLLPVENKTNVKPKPENTEEKLIFLRWEITHVNLYLPSRLFPFELTGSGKRILPWR